MTPEVKKVRADVAFIPIGGTYTMNAKEADDVNIIKPKVVVPTCFGSIAGSTKDVKEFINELDESVKCKILLDLLEGAQHLTHSTIKLTKGPVIYFDPIGIHDEPKDADMVFITHNHHDHFSKDIIKRIVKENAHFIAPADVADLLRKGGINNITEVVPNQSYSVEGINFTTVPSYNINKNYHLKENNWVGYVVEYHNTSYYIAGDTDLIPEIENLNVDVAFLPVGGTYTMNANEAAKAANLMKPLVAVPVHFGSIVGTTEDANTFISELDKSIMGKIMLADTSK